jgi:hypothetical protein
MLRVPGGIEHVADGLTNWQAWGLAELDFSMVTPKALLAGRTLEADIRQKEPIKPKVAERAPRLVLLGWRRPEALRAIDVNVTQLKQATLFSSSLSPFPQVATGH